MNDTVFILALVGLGAAVLLGLWKVATGSSLMDRILAFDLVATCAVGVMVMVSARWQTVVYLEAILIVSLLGFFTTVAFTLYLVRARPREVVAQDSRPLNER